MNSIKKIFLCCLVLSLGSMVTSIPVKAGNPQSRSRVTQTKKKTATKKQTTTQKQSPATSQSSSSKGQTFTVKGVSFKMIPVDGASFSIGMTEVTQALWTAVMGNNPSKFKGNNLPVEQVSWNDCHQFITRLNQLTGNKFRLPNVSEWEIAAYGGSKKADYLYSGSHYIDKIAWYKGNSGGTSHKVGTKQPNQLGIYDMTGNVWEWCDDDEKTASTLMGYSHLAKGGGWGNTEDDCLIPKNVKCYPNFTRPVLGFRLAMDIEIPNYEVFNVKGVEFKMIKVGNPVLYYIGMTEVTQTLWEAVMGNNPSLLKSPNHPVEQVSWDACQVFVKRLSELTGKKFRLPNETEWLFAAYGGKNKNDFRFSGSNNIDEIAWHLKNSDRKTHAVATKKPNQLGIYDMIGNVKEWCEASQKIKSQLGNDSGHVVMGSSFFESDEINMATYSTEYSSDYKIGFRLAMDEK